MKMIESKVKPTHLQTIERLLNYLRQRQRTLNSAFKISYKKVLRKNHSSRLFKLYKKNQLKRQKSFKLLPINPRKNDICPNTITDSKLSEAAVATDARRVSRNGNQCENTVIRTQGPQTFIQVPNLSEQKTTGVTFSSEELNEQRQRDSLPNRKILLRPPFLSRQRSEKIITPLLNNETEEGEPSNDRERGIFQQINKSSFRQKEYQESGEGNDEMGLLKRIKDLTSEQNGLDFQDIMHEKNIERVSWRRPGKSSFFFNRFRNDEEISLQKSKLSQADELSSAASSDDIVL